LLPASDIIRVNFSAQHCALLIRNNLIVATATITLWNAQRCALLGGEGD
jgi:hypothetical protein